MKQLTLDECIDTINDINEDNKYKIKACKSPIKKRSLERNYQFFNSINKYLKELKKLYE